MPDEPNTTVLPVTVTLLDVTPPIWRELLVPAELTLARLHECIQVAMGWTFSHLHEFDIGGRRYGEPDGWDTARPVARDSTVKLSTILARGIDRFHYTYDFGDDWRHEIVLGSPQPAEPMPSIPGSLPASVGVRPKTAADLPVSKRFSKP